MNIPNDTRLVIVAYRDFYDVPRLMLASDQDARFWILDSPFDDSADEYSPNYAVHFVGHDPSSSRQAFELWSSCQTGSSVGTIAVNRVRFDETRRREMVLT